MQIFRNLTDVQLTEPTVLTIGTFDGLHRGHQALVTQLKEAAHKRQALSAVIAFHPRPKTVLAPHLTNNDYLTTREEKIRLFEQLGLNVLVLTPFTLQLAQTTAYTFVRLLSDHLNLVELWAGHDFALGKNREGTVEKLREMGQEFNYTVHEFEPLLLDGEVVSSTRIRRLLLAGDVRQATRLLGRYPTVRGEVVQGARRGHTIGFPTANVAVPSERLIPANGVYATFVRGINDRQRYPGVTNIGVRPSFNEEERTVEAYIFDFDQDIYGQQLTVEFVERLRPEKKFSQVKDLLAQINRDSEQARILLAAELDGK
jgi:riboflavin kinase/FMN adenylyltransferase